MYDALNRVRRERRPGPPAMEVVLEYDPSGNMVRRTESPDFQPRSTEHRYDARANLTATIHPIRSIVDHFAHDENDNLVLSQRGSGPGQS